MTLLNRNSLGSIIKLMGNSMPFGGIEGGLFLLIKLRLVGNSMLWEGSEGVFSKKTVSSYVKGNYWKNCQIDFPACSYTSCRLKYLYEVNQNFDLPNNIYLICSLFRNNSDRDTSDKFR